MGFDFWIAYLLTISAVIVSPGPDTLLILRNTISSGRSNGVATVLGVQIGLAVHTTLALLGISLLIAKSPLLFQAVAIAGAVYIGWLGLQGLLSDALIRVEGHARQVTGWQACRDAMLTNLLNPKVVLLFLALMPNFVRPAQGDVGLQLTLLGVVLIVVNSIWQLPMVWVADRIRGWLQNPRIERVVSCISGMLLIVIAGAMLWHHVVSVWFAD